MSKTRTIAVMTGTRAEYGLLEPVIREIRRDPALRLQLIVTGAHLSRAHGMTVREIEADGHPIAARIDLRLGQDGGAATAAAMARGVAGFAEAFAQLKPDLLVVLGDRTEVLAAVSAALPFRLPVAHLHGGEASEGVWDESIRHAVTKLSHLHFPAEPAYARRIRQLGEDPRRIFCFGSPAADRLRSLPRLETAALERALDFPLRSPLGVVTFHPETLKADGGLCRFDALLSAVRAARGHWIFTYPNADAGGRAIIRRLDEFVQENGNDAHSSPSPRRGEGRVRGMRCKAFESLGQLKYYSLLRRADVMVGNSSSGLLEAPYFRLPVVNIGDRQRGRLRAGNVIDVPGETSAEIVRAIRRAVSPRFRRSLARLPLASASASPSGRIVRVLKTVALGEALLKKHFHENQ